jgi:hypothetical protein
VAKIVWTEPAMSDLDAIADLANFEAETARVRN